MTSRQPVPLTDSQAAHVDRGGDLKGALVKFALEPHLQRPLREQIRSAEDLPVGGDSQMIHAIESLLFEYRFDDGSTVIDRYVARKRGLDRADADVLRGWNDSVLGPFEVMAAGGSVLECTNLLDDQEYLCVATVDGFDFADLMPPGTYVLARVLPMPDGVWVLSGEQMPLGDDRSEVAELVESYYWEQPHRVLANPEYRRSSERITAEIHDAFVELFGSDTLVVPGREVPDRFGELMARHNERIAADQPISANRLASLTQGFDSPELVAASNVAMCSHPRFGVGFYANYEQVKAVFDDPELARDREHRTTLRGYLEDDSVPPWLIERLASEHSTADAVFAALLNRPRFRWDRDGEALLRKHKAAHFQRPETPMVVVPPHIVQERMGG